MKALLLKFFENVGKTNEVELFLKEFQDFPRVKLVIIRINYDVLKTSLDTLAENIAMMNRLDIYPIITIGNPPPESTPLSKTEQSVLKRKFTLISRKLILAVRRKKGHILLAPNMLGWTKHAKPRLTVSISKLTTLMTKSKTPIIPPSILKNDKPYFITETELTQALIKTLKPKKFIIITAEGGILDHNFHLLPFLNVSPQKENYHPLLKRMKTIVQEIRHLLTVTPDTAFIVTSAQNLLKEMFTIKGHGTFIKKHTLQTSNTLDTINKKKLTTLLEAAFKKELSATYFNQTFDYFIYEKEYAGVAVIQNIQGIPYLDKFAVSPLHDGTGLGKTLWNRVLKKYPSLTWRALPNNPLNAFYFRECDGCIKYNDWVVFWRGLDQHPDLLPLIAEIRNKPPTLIALEKE